MRPAWKARAPRREFKGLPEDPRDVLAREGGWKKPRRGPRPAEAGSSAALPDWAARKAGIKRGKPGVHGSKRPRPAKPATVGETVATEGAEAVPSGEAGLETAEGSTTTVEVTGTPVVKAPRPPTIRLQKYLADAGVASRRGSEDYIRAGRVTINGEVVTELGVRMDPAADEVQVDGQTVTPLKKLYVALNKPVGYTCTKDDPNAAQKVGELLPAEWTSLYSVGRLDRESEGLLFLTNDGDFCLHLTHPRYGVRKVYRAMVAGMVTHEILARFRTGVESDGETLRIVDGRVLSATRGESVVELELAEGRNREIRRLFASESMEVLQLMRTQIGSIKLGELKPGRWRTLTPEELKTLLTPS